MKNFLLLILFIQIHLGFSQADGGSLIKIHNIANKTTIDATTNPIEGSIAYNLTDKSIYVYDGTNWIADSFSKTITNTPGAITLDENNYTLLITDTTHTITLPAAGAHAEREFVLKNTTISDVSISTYIDNTNTTPNTIPAGNVLKIQSDGNDWYQVNNYGTAACATEPTLNISTLFTILNFDDVGNDGNLLSRYGNGSSPDITELQVLITNVPYSTLTFTDVELTNSGPTVDITNNTSVISGESCNGTGYDHLITISGVTIAGNRTIDMNFDTNIDGNTDDETTCNGCTIEFFTN